VNQTPKVTLLTWTKDPLETVYAVWCMSKSEAPLLSTDAVKAHVAKEEIEKLFAAVIAQQIPVGAHIDFVFAIENVSISWREQAVRHTIGTTASPERLGADMVMLDTLPDIADSRWWSQSMRIQDMRNFASAGHYRLPQSLEGNDTALQLYHNFMKEAQTTYRGLQALGVPLEDAREVLPLAVQHRISWRLNINSLQHIVGKRSCWILQQGIWGPVIEGMISELATKVHPIFRELATPPCITGDNFTGCVYMEECRRRIDGEDALPPCPLHFNYHELTAGQRGMLPLLLNQIEIPMRQQMIERAEQYVHFWGRDPFTGERLLSGER
jgi:thymidylate synthase (FAD)